jgi:hypothetical protein
MKIPARQLQTAQQVRVIKQPPRHQMHHVVFFLDNAMYAQQLAAMAICGDSSKANGQRTPD